MTRLAGLIVFSLIVPGIAVSQNTADSARSTADDNASLLAAPSTQTASADHAIPNPQAAPQVQLPSALRGLQIGTKTYIRYEYMQVDDEAGGTTEISRFYLKRGYLDVRKSITDYMSFRITPDVHQDDTGDWKVRIKYLHARFTADGNDVIGKPFAEVGIAHMPWLDFEEHINLFRMQGTMFMERNSLFNSADLGFMVGANLGSELPDEYKNTVNSSYAGRWGSFQLGVFNGGGYHAEANNNTMALEGRITIRPLPDVVPGLQFSAFGLTGKGNTAAAPDWNVLTGMVSFESQYFNGTGQYYTGTGTQNGSAVDASGNSLEQDGYSLFGELRMPQRKEYSVFARYDRFDTDTNSATADVRNRFIIGFAWQFFKENYWVVNYDRLGHSHAGLATEYSIEVTLQMKY